MPQPNDAVSLPEEVSVTRGLGGLFALSQHLVDLLTKARNNYDWPSGTGAAQSQQVIIDLILSVNALMIPTLTPNNAHEIVIAVSQWAGNNTNSHNVIRQATTAHKVEMQVAITNLITPGSECIGIGQLCALPGISLIIASKIFRFCSPHCGAAVDRHASYFFNSLQIVGQGSVTDFVREWSNAQHNTSRLAIYSRGRYTHNKAQYFSHYLPALSSIAFAMNAIPCQFTCASRSIECNWTPADVEMAAYYWWAQNGAR